MPPKLFDIHTHVQFAAFSEDADSVIRRALDAGIWLVNVGTQRDTSQKAVEIAECYQEGVYATIGLHPIHTEQSYHDEQELGITNKESGHGFLSRGEEFDYGYYKKLAGHPKVVGIGECGLDYYRLPGERKGKKEAVFLEHIRFAQEVAKPLMIHCRKAFSDIIRILEHHKSDLPEPRGIVHFFSGSVEDAKKLLDLGFSFSFGGVITFVRDYDDVLKFIPLERILLETDAPYVAPVPYRGKRNEPFYVDHIAKRIAELKGTPFEESAFQTTRNAFIVFPGIKNAGKV